MNSSKSVLNSLSKTSLWLSNAGLTSTRSKTIYPKLTKINNQPLHDQYDVIVIGGGIVGITAAYQLKQYGKKVVLIEGRNIGGGTTGFSTAKLSSLHGPIYAIMTKMHDDKIAKMYYDMNQQAIHQIETLVHDLNLDCEFEKRSHTVWTSDETKLDLLKKEYDVCTKLGIPCEFLNSTDLQKELPSTLHPLGGLKFPDQAQFNSYKYCVELSKHIQGNGCDIFEDSLVSSIKEGKPHTVYVEQEPQHVQEGKEKENNIEVKADYIILATHLPIMDRSLHFAFLEPSRSHCIAIKVNPTEQYSLHNMFINADTPLRSLRTSQNDEIIVIAGETIKMGDESNTIQFYENLEKWAKQHFQVQEVIAKWSAMDYFSSDHIPFIGYLYRGTQSIFTATGFNKWGLTNGVAGAQLITDLVMGKEFTPYHKMVDARRWNLLKQFAGLSMENWHVSKHFIKDKFLHALNFNNVDSIKKGHGGVVNSGLTKVGVYKDENGKCYCIKPTCT